MIGPIILANKRLILNQFMSNLITILEKIICIMKIANDKKKCHSRESYCYPLIKGVMYYFRDIIFKEQLKPRTNAKRILHTAIGKIGRVEWRSMFSCSKNSILSPNLAYADIPKKTQSMSKKRQSNFSELLILDQQACDVSLYTSNDVMLEMKENRISGIALMCPQSL